MRANQFGFKWWAAQTCGTVKIVVRPFGIQFNGDDRYLVVQYYDRIELAKDQKAQHPNIFRKLATKACVYSHLVVHVEPFQMVFNNRGKSSGTTYKLNRDTIDQIELNL